MKTTVHETCSSMALIFVCVSMLASVGIAHDVPPPSTPGGLPDVQKCWSSLQSIEGCVVEIYRSFFTGKIQLVCPACCKAFVAVDEACWSNMFPFNPFFPPLLKSFCAVNGGSVAASVASVASVSSTTTPPTPKTDDGNLPFPGLLPPGGFTDVNKCWASLQSIEGCVAEIFQSFLTGHIQPLSPTCCKAFVAVDEACWPSMFPFNPFFPPLIKSYCKAGSTTTTTTTVKKTVIA